MTEEQLTGAKQAIERVQSFDAASLAREAELGRDFHFKDVVPEAARVIDLFRQFPLEFLDRLPLNHVDAIKGAAQAFHQTLANVLSFSPRQENPSNAHKAAIAAVNGQYQQVFNQLERRDVVT